MLLSESLVGQAVGKEEEEAEMTLAATAQCVGAVDVAQVAQTCRFQRAERVTRHAHSGPQPQRAARTVGRVVVVAMKEVVATTAVPCWAVIATRVTPRMRMSAQSRSPYRSTIRLATPPRKRHPHPVGLLPNAPPGR